MRARRLYSMLLFGVEKFRLTPSLNSGTDQNMQVWREEKLESILKMWHDTNKPYRLMRLFIRM